MVLVWEEVLGGCDTGETFAWEAYAIEFVTRLSGSKCDGSFGPGMCKAERYLF